MSSFFSHLHNFFAIPFYCSEKDIDEVLQTDLVFTNVSKGQEAKKDDLLKAFGTDNRTEICKIILAKGEAQISEKERNIRNESQYKEIAKIVAEKTYNTETKRPFPAIEIENEMKECHFSMKPNKSAKQQALELIKALSKRIPIERAQMRLCADLKSPSTAESCKKLAVKVETEATIDGRIKILFLVDPGNFKEVETIIRGDQGNLEIVDFKNVIDTDEAFE